MTNDNTKTEAILAMIAAIVMCLGAGIAQGVGGFLFALGLWIVIAAAVSEICKAVKEDHNRS